ncbi:hypothetical protein KZ774_24695 [Escherichia coli]|nr:hypothetical protein [Escherichia coli]
MADWFIATEGVKVVKDSASLGAADNYSCIDHRICCRSGVPYSPLHTQT